jgi:hypothetical protein
MAFQKGIWFYQLLLDFKSSLPFSSSAAAEVKKYKPFERQSIEWPPKRAVVLVCIAVDQKSPTCFDHNAIIFRLCFLQRSKSY